MKVRLLKTATITVVEGSEIEINENQFLPEIMEEVKPAKKIKTKEVVKEDKK